MKIHILNHINDKTTTYDINSSEELDKLLSDMMINIRYPKDNFKIGLELLAEELSRGHTDAWTEQHPSLDSLKKQVGELDKALPLPENMAENVANELSYSDSKQSLLEKQISHNGKILTSKTSLKESIPGQKRYKHTLSDKNGPFAVLEVVQSEGGKPRIEKAGIKKEFRGQGLGQLLYKEALNHHGSLQSDYSVSQDAQRVWDKLSLDPSIKVTYGQSGTMQPHTAELQKNVSGPAKPFTVPSIAETLKDAPVSEALNHHSKPYVKVHSTEIGIHPKTQQKIYHNVFQQNTHKGQNNYIHTLSTDPSGTKPIGALEINHNNMMSQKTQVGRGGIFKEHTGHDFDKMLNSKAQEFHANSVNNSVQKSDSGKDYYSSLSSLGYTDDSDDLYNDLDDAVDHHNLMANRRMEHYSDLGENYKELLVEPHKMLPSLKNSGKEFGFLKDIPQNEWVDKLKGVFDKNRDYSHIIKKKISGQLSPAISINDELSDGYGRAHLAYALGEKLPVLNYKRKKLTKSFDLQKSIPVGMVYVAMDGDNAGAQVERAALQDDIKVAKDISQRILKGSSVIAQMAQDLGGEIVISGGDDTGFLFPENKINLIDSIRQRFFDVAGFTITAGIGKSIPNAVQALLYGKLHGKDKTVIWTETIGKELDKLSLKETPEEKILSSGVLKKTIYTQQKLQKDVGRITFPKINPKMTRPDQEVAYMHEDITPKVTATKIANFLGGMDNKQKQAIEQQVKKPVKAALNSKVIDSGYTFGLPENKNRPYIPANVAMKEGSGEYVKEHEGLHHLINHISNQSNIPQSDIYNKMNSFISLKTQKILKEGLKTRGYKGTGTQKELITSLRDTLVHQPYRDTVLKHLPESQRQAAHTRMKIEWRKLRDWAKEATIGDFLNKEMKKTLGKMKDDGLTLDIQSLQKDVGRITFPKLPNRANQSNKIPTRPDQQVKLVETPEQVKSTLKQAAAENKADINPGELEILSRLDYNPRRTDSPEGVHFSGPQGGKTMAKPGPSIHTVREHEGFHNLLGAVANRHGEHASDFFVEKALSMLHPEDRKSLQNHIANMGYDDPRHQQEEMLAGMRDILTRPDDRQEYMKNVPGHTPDNNIGQKSVSRLKTAWKSIRNFANNLHTRHFNDLQDMNTLAESHKPKYTK